MTEEEKLAMISLTPEQEAVLDVFIAAYEALEAAGIIIFESEGDFFAASVARLDDYRISWEQLTNEETGDGWIDEFPFWRTSQRLPYFASHMCDDDALQGRIKSRMIDRNLFN